MARWMQAAGSGKTRAPILYTGPNLDHYRGLLGPRKMWLEDKRELHAPALRRETDGRGCSTLQPADAALEVGCTGARVPAPKAACRVTIEMQACTSTDQHLT